MRAPKIFALTNPKTAALDIASGQPQESNYAPVGHTDNFSFYYRRTLGAAGAATAATLLARCENDYETLRGWFNVIPRDLPFHVYVVDDVPGAMHYGCADTEIYVGTVTEIKNPMSATYNLLLGAEVVEVFEAVQHLGWNCGYSNGEALSRVLAAELYPLAETPSLVAAPTWLDQAPIVGPRRANWIDETDYLDTNGFSIGCSVLFLNWLRYVRGYSWNAIVAAGADTLGETYRKLSLSPDGWTTFRAFIDARWPPGFPSNVSTDNPFR